MRHCFRLILVSLFVINLLATATPGLAIQPGGVPGAAPQPSAAADINLPVTVQMQAGAVQPGAAKKLGAAVPAAPSFPTFGPAGTSYRYTRSFGTLNEFYTDDTAHLNNPNGLFATADGVWVTEERGFRALKYDLNGNFAAQVGQAGHRFLTISGQEISVENFTDAAVDASGNLWVVNNSPGNVLAIAPNGSLLGTVGYYYNSGPNNDQFNGPMGVAFDSAGRLYVSDQYNHRVQVFNVTNPASPQYYATIGQTGNPGPLNNQFRAPTRIAIDASNHLYVVDTENQRVQIINVTDPLNPAYVGTLGTTGSVGGTANEFCYPRGVAVTATSIFVADSCNQRVQVFDRNTLSFVTHLGTDFEIGTDTSHFFDPQDVAVDANGLVYVADKGNDRVQVFSGNLVYSRQFGVTRVPYLTDTNHYNRPRGVAVDASGNIYFTEDGGQRLFKLSPTGSVLWSIGEAGVGLPRWITDTNHLYDPQDVAINPVDGNIYVANASNNEIRVYSPAGVYQKAIGTGWGSGQLEFGWIAGFGFGPDGTLYVADSEFHIVKIYNANGTYRTQMGVSGSCGSDATHFCSPRDVVVDSKGNIYISEDGNAQVRMFDKNFTLVRTLGVTGQNSDDYGYFAGPSFMAVDRNDNIFISSTWNHSIYEYDASGRFLAAMGSGGNTPSNLSNVAGLAIGPDNSLYAADYDHARLVRFDRGYPYWNQNNFSGFGYRWNARPNELVEYKDHLYTGSNYMRTLQVLDAQGNWTEIDPGSWGSAPYIVPNTLAAFGNYLYASAWTGDNTGCAGQTLKRFDGTTWTDVAVGGLNNDKGVCEIDYLQVFNNALYAFTYYHDTITSTSYVQVWRSDTGDVWAKVTDLTILGSEYIQTVTAFNGALYFGTYDVTTENGRVWRSTDGVAWNPASDLKFGNTGERYSPVDLASYKGYLYAGLRNYQGTGGQVWRCQVCTQQSDWTLVNNNGFDGADVDANGKVDNFRVEAFTGYKDKLYAGVGNTVTGMQVWSSEDGLSWKQVAANGFGYGDDRASYGKGSVVFNGRLMFAATNYNLGIQVWEYVSQFLFLPNIVR